MEENVNLEEQKTLPQFLKVLCILTYIGVGLSILFTLIGWWVLKYVGIAMEQNGGTLEGMQGMDDPDKIEQTMLLMQYATPVFSSAIIGCIICLIGALQMQKQKKMGFYIYTFGEVAPVIVSMACLGLEYYKGLNLIGLVVPVIFIVLYGINFKHLNN